jgi:hypothetical protein
MAEMPPTRCRYRKESLDMTREVPSIVEFYRLIEEARPPQRADRSAIGTLPMRAARYCDAITSASAFGWWAFPPMDVRLLWDGADILWQLPGTEEWLVLQPSVQYPGLMRRFDEAAPEALRGCSPPFLTALPEPGMLQIWTGLMARTAPEWSLLIRSPANLPLPGGVAMFEGIVETDRWFGPVFINLRFTRSHKPIRLRADFPLAQLQPLPRVAYDDDTLGAMTLAPDLASLKAADWEDYRTSVVAPNDDPDRPYGSYAIAARRRRRSACPYAAA